MKYLKTYENKKLNNNLKLLEEYISILKKNRNKKNKTINHFEISYLIILYNYLLLESIFPNKIKYPLNKYLYLEPLDNSDEDMFSKNEQIYDIFNSLYNVNSIIRYNVEKISDHDSEMYKIIKKYPKIYKELLTETDLNIIKMSEDIKKYNL